MPTPFNCYDLNANRKYVRIVCLLHYLFCVQFGRAKRLDKDFIFLVKINLIIRYSTGLEPNV